MSDSRQQAGGYQGKGGDLLAGQWGGVAQEWYAANGQQTPGVAGFPGGSGPAPSLFSATVGPSGRPQILTADGIAALQSLAGSPPVGEDGRQAEVAPRIRVVAALRVRPWALGVEEGSVDLARRGFG